MLFSAASASLWPDKTLSMHRIHWQFNRSHQSKTLHRLFRVRNCRPFHYQSRRKVFKACLTRRNLSLLFTFFLYCFARSQGLVVILLINVHLVEWEKIGNSFGHTKNENRVCHRKREREVTTIQSWGEMCCPDLSCSDIGSKAGASVNEKTTVLWITW